MRISDWSSDVCSSDLLTKLMAEASAAGRISATDDATEAVMESEISLISVGTPSGAGGGQSLAALDAVVSSIGQAIRHKNEAHSVVVRSTVAPRTTEERVAPKLEAIVGREIGNGLGLCFNHEIGRASGRERVGQYV